MSDNGTKLAPDSPVCEAIVICSEVIEDKRTNNKTLVSLFNNISVLQLPSVHSRMFVMASLTNLRGKIPISFSIKTPSDKEVLRVDGEADSDDPLAVLDLVVEVLGLPITEEGTYFVDVLSGDSPLGSRRFHVKILGG